MNLLTMYTFSNIGVRLSCCVGFPLLKCERILVFDLIKPLVDGALTLTLKQRTHGCDFPSTAVVEEPHNVFAIIIFMISLLLLLEGAMVFMAKLIAKLEVHL